MATTKIRGNTQIEAATITNAEIAAAAAIANSKLAGDPQVAATANKIVLRDANGRAQVADPSAAADIATKQYVDNLINGVDVKASVRVATTANITLSGTQTVDGVALVVNDRVLVKDQSTAANNGIYIVQSGAWSRATDADANAEVTAGMYVFVEEGTANADTGWMLTTNNPITLGTTALTFAQFSGAGQIVAGAGLTKTGNQLDVGTGNGIQVNADSVEVIYGASGDMVASAVGDTVSAGVANKAARTDHRHAREAFATPTIALGAAAAAGAAGTLIRSDATIAAFDATTPTTQAIGDAAAVGSAAFAARRDHKHGMPGFGSPVASAVGDTTSDGVATTIARSDHRHAREAFGNVGNSRPTDGAFNGTASTVARSDHQHGREYWTTTWFIGDGATAAFYVDTCNQFVDPLVFLNGILQRPGGASYDYTLTWSGATKRWTATFNTAPASGDTVAMYTTSYVP